MKTDKDIEYMLMNTSSPVLRDAEKASLKSELLAYAAESLHNQKPILSPWSQWMLRSSVSFASLLFVFVGTAYASQDSLPGEILYPFKVHVVEEMVLLTKIDTEDKLAYDTALLETRFAELKEILTTDEQPDTETLATVAGQIDQHISHATALMSDAPETDVSQEAKIETIAKINQITEAQATIATDHEELASISHTLDTVNDVATDALATTIETFVATETKEEVQAYLSEQIAEMSAAITGTTTDSVTTHLEDVQTAIEDGQTEAALVSIIAAQEALEVETLLETVPAE